MTDVPYPTAVERYPTLRQSLLASFDECAMSARMQMDYSDGWSGHPQARGQITHAAIARCLEVMAQEGTTRIEPEVALAILHDTLRQHDWDGQDYVSIPFQQIKDCRWTILSWAAHTEWDIPNLVDVERRLGARVSYPNPAGGQVDRMLTGRLDALFIEGEDASRAIVPDWKDAQPLDAKILTPSGWTTMGELSVGDVIVGSDGKPTAVTGVHPKGKRLVYEVEFADGSRTRCCDHHWWRVRRSSGNWRLMRLQDIMRDDKSRWHIPAVEPVEFDHRGARQIDPYLLGALLGDGDFPADGSVGFTSADDEVLKLVGAALPAGMEARHQARYNWRLVATSRSVPNPLRAALAALGLMGQKAATKFIPEEYLFAPVDARLEMLRGLMDTDGFIDAQGRMSFASASPQLAADVQFLVRSLGGRATLKVWPRKRPHHDTHVVYLRMNAVPFHLARKRTRWHPPMHGMTRSIRSVKPLGVEAVQCIEVDATDMLYVTDDFIVTHNTWALPPESDGAGFFQQRWYGMLVMRNFPTVMEVVLREFYVRFSSRPEGKDGRLKSPVRESTVTRDELPDIEAEFSALAERFDRAVEVGELPWDANAQLLLEDLRSEKDPDAKAALRKQYRNLVGPWKPSPGKHCLSARTRFITDRGVRTLGDACGERVRVLNRHGVWEDAVVASFGMQPLLRVTFSGGEIVEATPDHRWWRLEQDRRNDGWVQSDERITTAEMDRAPLVQHASLPILAAEGVRHGVVYGDGHIYGRRNWSMVRLQPHKALLASWFDAEMRLVKHYPGQSLMHDPIIRRSDGCVDVVLQPVSYKDLPATYSPEYARGFIAGLLATDGSVDSNGGVTISCEGRERAERIAEIARVGGAVVQSVRLMSSRVPATIGGVALAHAGEQRELMSVRLKPRTAPVLRPDQSVRLKPQTQMREMYREVVKVESLGVEEVYCAVVPGSESFTLASGLATSNCSYCPRPAACPIFPSARGEGELTSEEQASKAAAELLVADSVAKQRRAALKAWTEANGPVPIRAAKDANRVMGFQPTKRIERPSRDAIERAIAEAGGDVPTGELLSMWREKPSSRFQAFTRDPEAEVAASEAEDDALREALQESLDKAKKRG